jgi:hypothetical protein
MMGDPVEIAMSTRQLISKTFDPTKLVLMGTAFDRAWSEVAHHFSDTDADIARSRLAEAILIVAADHDRRDISALKTDALQVLAFAYRRRWPLDGN